MQTNIVRGHSRANLEKISSWLPVDFRMETGGPGPETGTMGSDGMDCGALRKL
jgi:hypothetical protein